MTRPFAVAGGVPSRVARDRGAARGNSPEAFTAFIRAEVEKGAKAVKAAGIKAD